MLVVITFSIGMRNYGRFQEKIDVSRAISIEIFLKLQWRMICWILMSLFFGTCAGKVLRPLPVRWEFLSPGWVKINTYGVVRGYLSLVTFGGIFRRSIRGLYVGSLHFLTFRLLWLLSFMKLYICYGESLRIVYSDYANYTFAFVYYT